MLVRYLRTLTGFERDARLFLVATLATGAALSIWWIDFNLYLASLGLSLGLVGLVGTTAATAGVVAAYPASFLSDRLGRRIVMLGGGTLMLTALTVLLVSTATPALFGAAACFTAGFQVIGTMTAPFLVEHSSPDSRSELFAVQSAVANATNVGAAIAGGFVAEIVARLGGLDAQGPAAYRILFALTAVVQVGALLFLLRLRDDRRAPAAETRRRPPAEPPPPVDAGVNPADPAAARADFVRLVLPNFLISVGAGQVIPYLNVFVKGKFGLDLASLNLLFAVTSLGTLLATLVQPAIARRFGKMGSVVLVQTCSLPFLVVLGFSPAFWTVAVAMAVRNSLMNAGNPIFNAFAMERVAPARRATLSATLGVLWSLGWAIGGIWYGALQSTLGFTAGYAVNFVTVIALYSLATALSWTWFGRDERRARRTVTRVEGAAAARG